MNLFMLFWLVFVKLAVLLGLVFSVGVTGIVLWPCVDAGFG